MQQTAEAMRAATADARGLRGSTAPADTTERARGQVGAPQGLARALEGQGSVFSAPGTEAFKQDFAKWEDLRRQATQALEHAEAALSKKLQAKQAKDRLAAGADDNPPPEYKKQVDTYFKAIAAKKKP